MRNGQRPRGGSDDGVESSRSTGYSRHRPAAPAGGGSVLLRRCRPLAGAVVGAREEVARAARLHEHRRRVQLDARRLHAVGGVLPKVAERAHRLPPQRPSLDPFDRRVAPRVALQLVGDGGALAGGQLERLEHLRHPSLLECPPQLGKCVLADAANVEAAATRRKREAAPLLRVFAGKEPLAPLGLLARRRRDRLRRLRRERAAAGVVVPAPLMAQRRRELKEQLDRGVARRARVDHDPAGAGLHRQLLGMRRANDASHATTASGWRRISSKSPRAAPSGSRSAAARAAAASASAFALAASKSPALRLFLYRRRPDAPTASAEPPPMRLRIVPRKPEGFCGIRSAATAVTDDSRSRVSCGAGVALFGFAFFGRSTLRCSVRLR